MKVPHLKGGNIVWTCVDDIIIEEKEDNMEIGLHVFNYKLLEEKKARGVREVTDGYTYFNNPIKSWTGY